MKTRTIEKITTSPLHQGFLGEGHLASAVVDGNSYSETDPFMLLMDDRLDLPGGEPVGGPHPHAGFETVTLIIQGNENDRETGSFEIMTAGKGIIHTEEITTKQQMQILQLWLVLPPEKRWTEPHFQKILLENVPIIKTDKTEVRVYSGSSQGSTSPIKNYTPLTLVDLILKADAEVTQQFPSSYNGFIYVLEGDVMIGEKKITAGQAGWFNRVENTSEESEVTFHTSTKEARFVLYAGKPHHTPVVHHGPFIGDTQEDIIRLYKEYRDGKMPHLNDLPESEKVVYRRA